MAQNKKKKIILIITIIAVGITAFLCVSGVIVFLLARNIWKENHKPEYHVGDTIKFGKYEQDGLFNKKEDIEWIVLSVEEDRILVVSKYALDAIPYNLSSEDVTWETSYVRKWLDENIYKRAFSKKEKEKILSVTLHNPDNPYYGSEGGNDTEDHVFCLSLEEAEKYFGNYNEYYENDGFGYNQNLICEPTQYAIDRSASNVIIFEENYYNTYQQMNYSPDVIGVNGATWWLRDPAVYDWDNGGDGACEVEYDGMAGPACGIFTSYVSGSVRPAMYLKY